MTRQIETIKGDQSRYVVYFGHVQNYPYSEGNLKIILFIIREVNSVMPI